jgi:hypothetical protein
VNVLTDGSDVLGWRQSNSLMYICIAVEFVISYIVILSLSTRVYDRTLLAIGRFRGSRVSPRAVLTRHSTQDSSLKCPHSFWQSSSSQMTSVLYDDLTRAKQGLTAYGRSVEVWQFVESTALVVAGTPTTARSARAGC